MGASLCTVKEMQQGHQGVQQMVSQLPLRANDRRQPLQGKCQALQQIASCSSSRGTLLAS